MNPVRHQGAALVMVLLLLSVLFTMAVAVQFSALLGALSVRNQTAHARAQAELQTMLTQAMLLLEEQAAVSGSLPVVAMLPAGVTWLKLTEDQGLLRLETAAPQLALEVTVRLHGAHLEVIMRR